MLSASAASSVSIPARCRACAPYAEATRFGQILVNSCFTLSLVSGLTVPDTSENAVANLGWAEIRLPGPVFVGDTL